jgi:hypothetical protein
MGECASTAMWCTHPKNTFASIKKLAIFGEITFNSKNESV